MHLHGQPRLLKRDTYLRGGSGPMGNSSKATNGGPFTLKGGNAQSGTLTTVWDGAYPVGYSPMNRQWGIVLGVGGDNSSTARGNFYEGVMTTGYASSATDEAVQANIVAAGYGR